MADEAENTTTTASEEPKKKGFNPLLLLIPIVIVGAFVSFSNKPKTDAAPSTDTTATEVTDVKGESDTKATASADSADVKEINMKAGAFYYDPKVITVKQGQKIKINFDSVDMMHNFVIDELNIKTEPVKGGNKSVIEFTADKKGTFEFYCSVGQHRQNGQVGTLIVE